ncbi:hypothetical protein AKJ16_DCAP19435 [Drosera capensis]
MSSPHCFQNKPAINPSSATGISGLVTEIGGLSACVTGQADSKRATLLISDVFGYETRMVVLDKTFFHIYSNLVLHVLDYCSFFFLLSGYEARNLRKLGDKVAAAGYLTVIPDFFFGDPIVKWGDPNFDIGAWLSKHGTLSFLLHSVLCFTNLICVDDLKGA